MPNIAAHSPRARGRLAPRLALRAGGAPCGTPGRGAQHNILVGWPTFEACSEYIAVDEMPGLQLKGKSAEKFRVLRVSAIREHREAPWVQIPTESALESYETYKHRYAQQSVFAAAQEPEA